MPTQLQISQADLQALDKQRYQEKQALVQRRLHCVYVKASMQLSNEMIGKLFGVHPNQVGQYVRSYQAGGLSCLQQTHYGTNRSLLEDHVEIILQEFEKLPPLSLSQARHKIIALTGIKRDISRIEAFLKRHGLRYLKAGYVPGKVDVGQQAQWLAQVLKPHIKAAQAGKEHLLFMDAAHFVLGAFSCCMWVVSRLLLRSGAGRHRINVLGVVHAMSKEISTLINTSYINAEVIMNFLHQLKGQYTDLPITIVLDNARYQHCKLVKACAEKLGITLLFLPPYSPNLNLIERVWKQAKKSILYGKYFDSPKLFHQTIHSFFNRINQEYQPQLDSLITLNFQTFEHSRIYAP